MLGDRNSIGVKNKLRRQIIGENDKNLIDQFRRKQQNMCISCIDSEDVV